MGDLPAIALIGFVLGDFEAAWDSLAANRDAPNRGNFLFALQSMVLLELACRVCDANASTQALSNLSSELSHREPRYFAELPAPVPAPRKFNLPSVGPDANRTLLAALFDLVRHGHAHQYQQMRGRLTDGSEFGISIAGAEYGAFLSRALADGRPPGHLQLEEGRDLWLRFRPDIFFLDLRDSIYGANLVDGTLALEHLVGPEYRFSAEELRRALTKAGIRSLVPG